MPRDKAHTIGGLPIKPHGIRARKRWENHRAVWELKLQGINKSQISKRLGIARPTVDVLLKAGPPDLNEPPPGETVRGARLRVRTERAEARIEAVAREATPAFVPTADPVPGSIEFLKTVQGDETVPITERIKCAIAVARLETAKEASTWTPPTDPTLWAEAMLDAWKSSSPEARVKVREGMETLLKLVPMARPVSEEGSKPPV